MTAISHVRIRNILGIDNLEFSPESGFNAIVGRNGSGKTSTLEAIKAAVGGGQDATLLRNGHKDGEIVLILDDGSTIERREFEGKPGTTNVRDASGKRVTRPIDHLRALTDAMSVNPIEFLTADKKKRTQVLLESLPLEIDVGALSAAAGIDVKAHRGTHALSVIETVRAQVFDARTEVNRDAKSKSGTVEQLRQAMPPLPAGVEGSEADLESELHAIQQTRELDHKRVAKKLGEMREISQQKITEFQDQIEKLREQIQAERESFAGTERLAEKQGRKTDDKASADSEPIRAQLAAIRGDRDLVARRLQTEETIAALQAEHQILVTESGDMTAALGRIDAYKLAMLASLPIAGLEMIDGDIRCDGVAIDRLNTARQVDIAVEIAKLRAGKLGVVCVDRIESLDADTYEEFRERAVSSGLQMFVTQVSTEEFAIGT
jgi:hypothetical protein